MNPEQWDRVQELFHQALDLAPDERAAFVRDSAGDDVVVRDEALSLLTSHDQEGILDRGDQGLGFAEDQFRRVSQALPERYALESEAGQGGMAVVYRAKDLRHQRAVAIKVFHPLLAHTLGVQRFLAEIETTAGLHHPNILPLFDSGEADGFLFFVMPFVEGETLRQLLRRERELAVADAVRIATRLCEALDYAHRRGVVHRDIKPGNILLQDGQPAIADFGIALAMGAAREERLTQAGYSLGTPGYMSPEQVTGEHVVGPASDIYALGCVLHEMLLGEPPFTGGTPDSVRRKIVEGLGTAPREMRRSIPEHVDAAIRRALERLPADRFATGRDFAAALANPAFRHGESVTAAGAGVWKPLALALASALVIGSAAIGWSSRGGEEPPTVQRFLVTPPPSASMLDTYIGVGVAISPDGEELVYVGDGAEGQQLWLRRLAELDATPIPWTEGADNPVFSPDGDQVAFRDGGDIEVVSLRGGLPTTIVEDGATGRYIDWGPDGYIYFAFDSTVSRVSASGGEVERFTVPLSGARTRHPRALPDERGLLVTLRRDAAAQATIGVVGPDGGTVRELLPGLSARYATSGHLVYATPDGALLAAPFDPRSLEVTGESVTLLRGVDVRLPGLGAQFALSPDGTLVYRTAAVADLHQPVWVSRTGETTPVDPEWSFRADIDDSSLELSPGDERLAVALPRGVGGGWDIWTRDLASGALERLTSEGIENRRPSWSSDGSWVTYIHTAGTGTEIRRRRADGAGEAETVPTLMMPDPDPSAQQLGEALFSPSGAWLVYRSGSTDLGSSPNIFALRVGVDTEARPLLAQEYLEWTPALSPDGRWLAYVSDQTGRREVYVRPFPDVESGWHRVSTLGGDNPVWSKSGDELFYRDAADDLIAVEVEVDTQFRTGRQSTLFSATPFLRGDGHPMYDVSADGNRFVMLARVESGAEAELVLVRNWLEDVRRSAPVR